MPSNIGVSARADIRYFSKGDAHNSIAGGNLRPGMDTQQQIIYYQVNYLLIILLGDLPR